MTIVDPESTFTHPVQWKCANLASFGALVMVDPIDFTPRAKEQGDIKTGRLGISIGAARIQFEKYGERLGPQIYALEPGLPAQQAGLEKGDLILELDGKQVADLPGAGWDLVTAATMYLKKHANKDIVLVIKRPGLEGTIKLVLRLA